MSRFKFLIEIELLKGYFVDKPVIYIVNEYFKIIKKSYKYQ